MKSLIILGRQPALGLAELESLYGRSKLQTAGGSAAILDADPAEIDFGRLGGSIKLAAVLETYGSTDWPTLSEYLSDDILGFIKSYPAEGKLRVGISAYGLRARAGDINKTGLTLKKIIKITGRSVRIIPNKFPELNSAQVLHNGLAGPGGLELVLVRSGNTTIVARTVAEQNIEAYSSRDQNRPKRDARVGMLPPKLAQIIINLANPAHNATVLDPFCGTGVLLQEAALMGFNVYGTDIEPRMVEYSQTNLQWLKSGWHADFNWHLEVGDATKHAWAGTIGAVAAETYLGRPLSSLPAREILSKIMRECDDIHDRTLRNLGPQLAPGTRLCLAVPAWKTRQGFLHLKTLDYLRELGYNRVRFEFAKEADLIYFRPDQTVARELIVLEKK